MKTPLARFLLLVVSLTSPFFFAAKASAALVVYDFESPAFSPGPLNGQQTWTAGATQPAVVEGGLSYTNGSVVHDGGTQRVTTTSNDVASTLLPSSIAAGETAYFSFLYRSSTTTFFWFALSDGGATSFNDSYGAVYTSGAFNARVRQGTTNTVSSTGVSIASSDLSGDASGGSTFLVVGRIDYGIGGNDRVRLQMNPSDNVEPTDWQADAQAASRGDAESLSHLLFRRGDEGTREFDFIRVGSTYDSVVIPEPSALLLGALGALGLLRRRRA